MRTSLENRQFDFGTWVSTCPPQAKQSDEKNNPMVVLWYRCSYKPSKSTFVFVATITAGRILRTNAQQQAMDDPRSVYWTIRNWSTHKFETVDTTDTQHTIPHMQFVVLCSIYERPAIFALPLDSIGPNIENT
jgi:hypothetical protein